MMKGYTVVIGISLKPNIPVRKVGMGAVLFLFETGHEFLELFDRFSIKENYRISFDRKYI